MSPSRVLRLLTLKHRPAFGAIVGTIALVAFAAAPSTAALPEPAPSEAGSVSTAIPPGLLILADLASVVELAPKQASERLDPGSPSCLAYEMRAKHLEKQLAELDLLVAELASSRRSNPAQLLELRRQSERLQSMDRELKSLRAIWRFEFSAPDGVVPSWASERQYRLSIFAPDFEWRGFDASEPSKTKVEFGERSIAVTHELLLGDACAARAQGKGLAVELRRAEAQTTPNGSPGA